MSELLGQPEFGRRLRALRKERGLSQTDITGPGMSAAYLSRLESGARPPTPRTARYLATKLNVPLSVFSATDTDDLSRLLATVTSSEDEGAVDIVQSAIQTDGLAKPATRWQALWILARLQFRQGQRTEELQTLRALTALSDEINAPELQVRSRNHIARCLRSLGDVLAAHSSAREAYELATAHDVPASDAARALMTLVSVEVEIGRLAEAHAHTDILEQAAVNTSGTLRVEALWAAATVRTREGDHNAAAELLERALKELDSRDDLTLWLRLRLAATSLYLQMTPPVVDEARRRLKEAERALSLVGTPVLMEEFSLLQALVAFRQGDVDRAAKVSEQLAETCRHLSFRDRIRLDLLRSQVQLVQGDRDQAIADLRNLALRAQEATYVDLATEIWRTLADLL